MFLAPGTRVGAYTVRGLLGNGAGSIVYEVESELGGRYALKLSSYLSGESPTLGWEMDQRFTRNIVCLEQLQDCHWVARIIAHDRHPDPEYGRQYLVQELVPRPEGLSKPENITAWARRTSPSLRKLVTVFMQLAEACEDMREVGIHNRDLKPENILMTPDGEPRLIDFNSAIWEHATLLTWPSAGHIPTSPAYMPPEMALVRLREKETGEEEPFIWTPGADLHALGVVFYRILVGEHPFDLGPDYLKEIAYVRPPRPMDLQSVPFGLSKVVMRLLEKEPAERYQEGCKLRDDLEALLRVADESWNNPYTVPQTDRHQYGDEGGAPYLGKLNGLMLEMAEPGERLAIPRSETNAPPLPAAFVSPEVAPSPARASAPSPTADPLGPTVSLPPASGRSPGRWLRMGAVAALLLAGIGAGLSLRARFTPHSPPLGEDTPAPTDGALVKGILVPSPASESSPPPVKKVIFRASKVAVLTAAATTALSGATCQNIKVRPEDELAWLANCSPEARETVRLLGIHTGGPDEEGPNWADLDKGLNVIPHDAGCEVREGEVRAGGLMSPLSASGTLIGTVREGSDRVFFRFHTLLKEGRKYPICAIGGSDLVGHGPGVAKAEDAPPASERAPNFIFITTGRFKIRVAPYIPNHGGGA